MVLEIFLFYHPTIRTSDLKEEKGTEYTEYIIAWKLKGYFNPAII